MNHSAYPPLPGGAALSRRRFVLTAAATTAAMALRPAMAAPAAADDKPAALIDTNVYFGRWPFRRTPLDDPPALATKLRAQGVTEAWTGSLDALLYKDISGVNERLAQDCARHGSGLFKPVGAINPKLPGWEEELRRCAVGHGMRAIRLHPNYHGYTLADPPAVRTFELAAERGLLVQIAVVMEDERTIHPLVNVPPVDPAPLASLLERYPKVRVQLLNAFRSLRGLPLKALAARGIAFEIATLEGVEGVAHLLAEVPGVRLCFGSYAPVFYFESARLKLQESVLNDAQTRAVSMASARALML